MLSLTCMVLAYALALVADHRCFCALLQLRLTANGQTLFFVCHLKCHGGCSVGLLGVVLSGERLGAVNELQL